MRDNKFLQFLKYTLYTLFALIGVICLFFGHTDKSLAELTPAYAPAPSAFVEVDGMQVHYRDEGDPTDTLPLVLIHGTAASLHTFETWAAALRQNKRVVRMDLPAFGLTGPFPNRDYSMDHYLEFLEGFLNARGIRRCILGGNSLGGQIAWEFTHKKPEMVDKLLLIDAAGYPLQSVSVPIGFRIARTPYLNAVMTFITPRSMVESSVENVYAEKTKVSDELVNRYFDLTLRAGNRQALVDRMNTVYDTTRVQRVKTIQQPTLVLWGAQDRLIPLRSAYRFHDDLPNDTLVILHNAGHVPMEECPNESLNAVLYFLKW
jgi:pimeloyl-ACP methyl ester carboxylesterase